MFQQIDMHAHLGPINYFSFMLIRTVGLLSFIVNLNSIILRVIILNAIFNKPTSLILLGYVVKLYE